MGKTRTHRWSPRWVQAGNRSYEPTRRLGGGWAWGPAQACESWGVPSGLVKPPRWFPRGRRAQQTRHGRGRGEAARVTAGRRAALPTQVPPSPPVRGRKGALEATSVGSRVHPAGPGAAPAGAGGPCSPREGTFSWLGDNTSCLAPRFGRTAWRCLLGWGGGRGPAHAWVLRPKVKPARFRTGARLAALPGPRW